jgi:hypothetical protein
LHDDDLAVGDELFGHAGTTTPNRRRRHPVFGGRLGAMRRALLLSCFMLAACGDSRPAPTHPTRESELDQAREAYAAYCALCPEEASCCLRRADFEAARWSAQAGPYLRALREQYECRRGDTLVDVSLDGQDRPLLYEDSRFPPPPRGDLRFSCQKFACQSSADVMARELDRALATPTPHPADALLVCSAPR